MMIKRKRRAQPTVPLTSMADIAFLLIIFFILTTTFMKEPPVPVDLPEDPKIEDVEESELIVTMDKQGRVYLNGVQTTTDGLEGELSGLLPTQETKLVHVKIDRSLQRSEFEPVLIGISEAGGLIAPLGDPGAPGTGGE